MDVLIAHAGDTSRKALAKSLQGQGYRFIETGDGAAAVEILMAGDAPRLAVLDWDLPGIDATEVCRLVRDFHREVPSYLLVLTGRSHEHEIAAALEAGANDCIRVPVTADELRDRVDMGRRFIEMPWGTPKEPAPGPAVAGAAGPPPGGAPEIPAREALSHRLAEELARAQRDQVDISIGVLSIALRPDASGNGDPGVPSDEIMREVYRRVKAFVRPYDVVGRLSRDEFMIVIPRTGEYDVAGVLERLSAAVTQESFSLDGHNVAVTVNIGGATGREDTPDELVRKAHDALNEAKARGFDRVVAGRQLQLEASITEGR